MNNNQEEYKRTLNQLKEFKKNKSNLKELSEDEQVMWYLCYEPFGLYYAAKILWKHNDQQSKDKALRYYKDFVKHQSINYEGKEVKEAIEIVLNAYRTGYGKRKEQNDIAAAFEQALVNKGFNVPKSEKVPTEVDMNKKHDKEFKLNTTISLLSVFISFSAATIGIIKKIKEK